MVQQYKLTKATKAPGEVTDEDLQKLARFDSTKPCTACLGILQQIDEPAFMERILDTIKNSGYETDLYYLALTAPVSVTVRHYQLWYHLQDTFPDINFLQTAPTQPDVADVKEVFKWIMGNVIFLKIQMRFQFEARFQARLNIQHPETQLECLKLTPEIDAAQFLREMETEKRKFLGLPEAPSSEHPNAEEIERAVDGHDNDDEREHSMHGPPRKRKKGGNLDSITQVNTKLRSLSKDHIIGLLTPDAPRNPETNKQISPPPTGVKKMAEFEFSFHHLSVYAAGRYCKYSRKVSQSPWIIDGVRKSEGSVQEFIGHILKKLYRADDFKFLSAGREDIDVRMLGRGRPWAMELVNPRRPKITAEEFKEAQKEINAAANGLIFISDLQSVSENQIKLLKEGEDTKKKAYRAVVWSAQPMTPELVSSIADQAEFTIDQLTPIRVLHRRSLMNRKKTIHNMKVELINPHYAIVELTTQAGTYIKEFVHSDLGRTRPSFCDFIKQDQADILQLDVVDVALDFPPTLQNESEPPAAAPITEGLDLSLVVPVKPEVTELSLND